MSLPPEIWCEIFDRHPTLRFVCRHVCRRFAAALRTWRPQSGNSEEFFFAALLGSERELFLWAMRTGYRLKSKHIIFNLLSQREPWLRVWSKCSGACPPWLPELLMKHGRFVAFRVLRESRVTYDAKKCHKLYVLHLLDHMTTFPGKRDRADVALVIYDHLFLDDECRTDLLSTEASFQRVVLRKLNDLLREEVFTIGERVRLRGYGKTLRTIVDSQPADPPTA